MKYLIGLIAAVAVAAGVFFWQGGGTEAVKSSRGPTKFPVQVAPVPGDLVEYIVSAVGSVEAFEVVQITARVAGVVEKVRFAEGDTVGRNQVMAEIEPERYKLAVQSAEATSARATASLAEAEAGLKRRQAANADNVGLIAGEEMESWRTRVRSASAERAQAKAATDLAALNLRDAFVRAPSRGAIQTRSVQTGQFVQPGAVLATLVRRDPLLLRFRVPEQEATDIRRGMPAFFKVGEATQEFEAKIVLVAERANPQTRMVSITAHVDSSMDTGSVRPGSFAQVRVPVGSVENQPVIPQMAVRPSEKGFLAYIVKDGVAQERVLKLGLRTAEGNVEVREGLKTGEQLIIRGAEAVFDGANVRVVDNSPEEDRP